MTRLANVSVGGTITAADTNAARQMINRTKQLIAPTSVSTGSIGTYGAVSVSGASSVSLNGVFTPEYDYYEIEFYLTTSGAAALQMLLRLSGTDATTAYDAQRSTTVNATVTAVQSLNVGNFVMSSPALAGVHAGTVKLYKPALAVATIGTVFATVTPNPMTTSAGFYTGGLQHRTLTTPDGCTITPSTGTITGDIHVYGMI